MRPHRHPALRDRPPRHVAAAQASCLELVVIESTGALAPRSVSLLRALGKAVQKPGAQDGTVYGRNRSATRSFFVHHVSAIAAAVADADALTIANAAAAIAFVGARA